MGGHYLLSELKIMSGRFSVRFFQCARKALSVGAFNNSPQNRRLVVTLFASAVLMLPTLSQAQSAIPRLAENAPDTYVVERGDTLWDISALFLDEPWRWPELWRVNPDIRDPNLIYPGDKLYLRWEDGKPGVYLSAGTPYSGSSDVVKLSPKVRTAPITTAIDALPREAIDPFIARHRFVTDFDLEEMPRIVGGYNGRLISGQVLAALEISGFVIRHRSGYCKR